MVLEECCGDIWTAEGSAKVRGGHAISLTTIHTLVPISKFVCTMYRMVYEYDNLGMWTPRIRRKTYDGSDFLNGDWACDPLSCSRRRTEEGTRFIVIPRLNVASL